MQSSSQKIYLSEDAYTIIGNVYNVMQHLRFGNTPFKGLNTIEVLMKVCGISHHAAQKAIEKSKIRSEASEEQHMGRPKRALSPGYSLIVEEILLNDNKTGNINTVTRAKKELKECYGICVSYGTLLRDIHNLEFKYEKGSKRNILHDTPANIAYRKVYLNKRFSNLDRLNNPIMAEVFLDHLGE